MTHPSLCRRLRQGFPATWRIARFAALLAFVAPIITGCSTISTYFPVMDHFGVYRLDINQGNYLSQDMVDKLKVGQSRQQVRVILGTPLLTKSLTDCTA